MRAFGRMSTACMTLAIGTALAGVAIADDFSDKDVQEWQAQFDTVAAEGRRLWTSPELGTNGVACGQCHPNAANTHPETYPKFQKQLGKVAPIWEMMNWCIRNPLEGTPLAADDPRLVALQAYVMRERRGVALAPGKH